MTSLTSHTIKSAFSILLMLLLCQMAWGQTISSTIVQVNMLEVYTSQGCSSCPPAERWMSKFKQDKRLWKQLVPMNFHVDYWDYLGWKDPYALQLFTQRQRDYKALGLSPTVATPGFIVSGVGWNGWFRGRPVPVKPYQAVGVLTAQINDESSMTEMGSAKITFQPTIKAQGVLQVHVAVLGFNQITNVKRGENSGKNLPHDFVVMGYNSVPLKLEKNKLSTHINLPDTRQFTSTKKALVFWVSELNNPSPIQVAANWWAEK